MPNLGFPEILLIVTAALLVFGPRKLPELGRSVGQMLREFRQHTSAITDEFREQVNAAPAAVSPAVPAPVSAAVPTPLPETAPLPQSKPTAEQAEASQGRA